MNRPQYLVAAAVGLLLVYPASQALAGGGHDPVTICHNADHNPVEVTVDQHAVDESGTDHTQHIEQGKDTWGPCPVPETTPPTTEPELNLPTVEVGCGSISVVGDFQQGEITFTGGVASLYGPSPLVATIGEDVNGGSVFAFVRAGDLEEQYVIITDCQAAATTQPVVTTVAPTTTTTAAPTTTTPPVVASTPPATVVDVPSTPGPTTTEPVASTWPTTPQTTAPVVPPVFALPETL